MAGGGNKNTPAGNTTVTQNQAPWTGQQPFLTSGFTQASQLQQNNPQQYYPGQTVAPLTPTQTQGLNLTSALGFGSTPEMSAAESGITNEINAGPGANPGISDLTPFTSGSLLMAGNPYFANAFQTAANQITPSTVAPFIGAGRYGSGAADAAEIGALTNAANTLSFQNYNNVLPLTEQAGANTGSLFNTGNTNLNFAGSLAPSLTNQDFTNLANATNAGGALQNQQQSYINEDFNRFMANQQYPWSTLGNYMSLIGNPQPGTSSTTSPYFTNPLGSGIATGAGLLGLANGLSNSSLLGSLFGGGAGAGLSSLGAGGINTAGLLSGTGILGSGVGAGSTGLGLDAALVGLF